MDCLLSIFQAPSELSTFAWFVVFWSWKQTHCLCVMFLWPIYIQWSQVGRRKQKKYRLFVNSMFFCCSVEQQTYLKTSRGHNCIKTVTGNVLLNSDSHFSLDRMRRTVTTTLYPDLCSLIGRIPTLPLLHCQALIHVWFNLDVSVCVYSVCAHMYQIY